MGGTGYLGPLEGPLHAQIYFVVWLLYPIGFHVRLSTFMDSLTSWALGFYSVLLGLFVYFNPTIALDISSASQGDCGELVSRVWRKKGGTGGWRRRRSLPCFATSWSQSARRVMSALCHGAWGHLSTNPTQHSAPEGHVHCTALCHRGPYGMTGFMPRGIKYLLSSDSPAFSATLTTQGALTYTTPAWGCCVVQ